MKTILTACVIVLVFAAAAFGDEHKRFQHQNWASVHVSSKDWSSFAMMETPGVKDPDNSILALSFYPRRQCRPWEMAIAVPAKTPPFSPRPGGMASIRVDERTIHNTPVIIIYHNATITTMFTDTPVNDNILSDAMQGNVIRFKIKIDGYSGTIYKAYSLSGFTSALKHSENICKSLIPQSTHSYFPP